MAKRRVRRRAKKILGEEPAALVWCEFRRAIPKAPKEVHRAAGKGRLKPGRHWMVYVGGGVLCVFVLPYLLLDTLLEKLVQKFVDKLDKNPVSTLTPESQGERVARAAVKAADRRDPHNGVFDGDWSLAAGQLLLRWYGQSPNRQRLVVLARDRICLAASPRRRLSPTTADDFQVVAEFRGDEARIEAEAGQPRAFATFRIHFADGSWLSFGNLAEPDDADRFLRIAGA